MTHLGLFEGIGGFSLAARWAGWETIAWCEIDKFCQQVLSYHFPKAKKHEDIKTTDFSIYRGKIGILTGGFPCQPYSTAGKRLGKEDERHLWPEMLRAIREVRPQWVVGENVFGIVNWNGGMVFEEVQADLEAEGYEVQPFILPAASVNAPHKRDRVWFVAYSVNGGHYTKRGEVSKEDRIQEFSGQKMESREFDGTSFSWVAPDTESRGQGGLRNEGESARSRQSNNSLGSVCGIPYATDTNNQGLQGGEVNRSAGELREESHELTTRFVQPTWDNFPTQSPVCSGDDGLSDRLDNLTFSKWRRESIKAYGNAIVPQVAYQIFKAINQYEEQFTTKQ
jgi:DNA (cytosine-5)-methyltransferase 1